jgi:modulator of FtsH protease HflK
VQSIPPGFLKPAFDRVVTAGQVQRSVLDNAQKYNNEVLSRASAESQSLTNIAETERVAYVRQITSLANNFGQILPDYNKNPQLYVQRELNDRLGRSLTNAEKWVLPSSVNGNSTELRLLLNREPPKPRTPPAQ